MADRFLRKEEAPGSNPGESTSSLTSFVQSWTCRSPTRSLRSLAGLPASPSKFYSVGNELKRRIAPSRGCSLLSVIGHRGPPFRVRCEGRCASTPSVVATAPPSAPARASQSPSVSARATHHDWCATSPRCCSPTPTGRPSSPTSTASRRGERDAVGSVPVRRDHTRFEKSGSWGVQYVRGTRSRFQRVSPEGCIPTVPRMIKNTTKLWGLGVDTAGGSPVFRPSSPFSCWVRSSSSTPRRSRRANAPAGRMGSRSVRPARNSRNVRAESYSFYRGGRCSGGSRRPFGRPRACLPRAQRVRTDDSVSFRASVPVSPSRFRRFDGVLPATTEPLLCP